MRSAVWVVCFAALGLVAESARAQPGPPAKELPPLAGDPFADPIFQPHARELKPVGWFDAPDPSATPPAIDRVSQVCNPCACAPGFTTWLVAEWLVGRTRGPGVSPIVTTGPVSSALLAGAIGQPTTIPLFGGRRVLNDWRSGLRVEAGVWLDDDHRTGISGRFYSLFSDSERFTARPDGTTVVNVPHFIAVGGNAVQIPVFVGFPGLTSGTVQTSARTTFAGGDVNFRRLLSRGERYRLDLLAGYRQLYLGDELGAAFAVAPVGLAAAVLPRLTGADAIRSRNDFFGPQIGLYASTGWNRLTLEGHVATALGPTASDLSFTRARSLTLNPASTTALLTAVGAPPLLAAPLAAATNQFPLAGANTGSEVTYFGVVAEGGLRLNWRATDHLRLTAGYGFLYWNNVRRAQEVFASSAVLRPHAGDFTTHLFSAGLDVRY
jgi:hypothetical protein